MDTFNRNSFIPQKKLVQTQKRRKAPLGIFFALSILIFVLAVVGVAGVFVYKELLKRDIDSKAVELRQARDAFDPGLIDELRRLDNRIKSSQTLLEAHVSMTPFFALLEDLTLRNVQFNQFELNISDSGLANLSVNGEAIDYATVVLQSDIMGRSKFLKDQIFSEVNLDESTGNIKFTLKAIIDPDLISFNSNIGNIQ
jgi:hypothetical protein